MEALGAMPNGKAVGPDGVPKEALEAGGRPYGKLLGHLMTRLAMRRRVSPVWR